MAPKGKGFFLAILIKNWLWLLHSSLELGMIFRKATLSAAERLLILAIYRLTVIGSELHTLTQ